MLNSYLCTTYDLASSFDLLFNFFYWNPPNGLLKKKKKKPLHISGLLIFKYNFKTLLLNLRGPERKCTYFFFLLGSCEYKNIKAVYYCYHIYLIWRTAEPWLTLWYLTLVFKTNYYSFGYKYMKNLPNQFNLKLFSRYILFISLYVFNVWTFYLFTKLNQLWYFIFILRLLINPECTVQGQVQFYLIVVFFFKAVREKQNKKWHLRIPT